jgi:hypothetical protein
MKILLTIALFAAAWTVALLWLMRSVHYRIGSRDLKIMVLGVCLRRVPLESITGVSKRRPKGFAEYWLSTFKPKHRLLTIRLSGGLRRHLCISPKNRYVFLADLKNAIRRVNPQALEGQASGGPGGLAVSFDLEETDFVDRGSAKAID